MSDKNEKGIYFTFPILLLKDAVTDIRSCLYNAYCYCLFDRLRHLYNGDKKQLILVRQYFKLRIEDFNSALETGEILYNSIPPKSPRCSISKKVFESFRKGDKDEYSIVCFLAFAALRSIIQRKKPYYRKIANNYLLARMSGNSSTTDPINPQLSKYNTRRQLDKIKKELRQNWGLVIYSKHMKGYYVSFKLTIKELMLVAESRRKSFKEEQRKAEEQLAYEEVMAELYGTQNKRTSRTNHDNKRSTSVHL